MRTMRSGILAAGMGAELILSPFAAARASQDRPPDHDHPAAGALTARQLAVKPFPALPNGTLFLRIENFPSMKAAHEAETAASAVVEWAGKIWLLTLGPRGSRSPGATLVAEIDRTRSRSAARGQLSARRQRSRFRSRGEGAGCAAGRHAPRAGDLLPSYRRTVPGNSRRNDSGAIRRRHSRPCKLTDATQHHGPIQARCILRRRSRRQHAEGRSIRLATKGHVQQVAPRRSTGVVPATLTWHSLV
jgi:hypothetical protein